MDVTHDGVRRLLVAPQFLSLALPEKSWLVPTGGSALVTVLHTAHNGEGQAGGAHHQLSKPGGGATGGGGGGASPRPAFSSGHRPGRNKYS